MTPKERAVEKATIWNANNPGHFPGRPLLEGLIENAVRDAVLAERERCVLLMESIHDLAEKWEQGQFIKDHPDITIEEWVAAAFGRAAVRIREEPK